MLIDLLLLSTKGRREHTTHRTHSWAGVSTCQPPHLIMLYTHNNRRIEPIVLSPLPSHHQTDCRRPRGTEMANEAARASRSPRGGDCWRNPVFLSASTRSVLDRFGSLHESLTSVVVERVRLLLPCLGRQQYHPMVSCPPRTGVLAVVGMGHRAERVANNRLHC